MLKNFSKLTGGVLLVAGTTVGAGMLALPIITGFAGFFPGLLLVIFYWVYMTYTALLMLEANLWMDDKQNLISMAKVTLGRGGQIASWIIYLFLLYSLTTAYVAGSATIVVHAIQQITGFVLAEWLGSIPLLVVLGYCVYRGIHTVDKVNRWLMLAFAATYVAMVVFLSPHVDVDLLRHVDWRYMLLGSSIVATSFGFHIIIPSLVTYLERDVSQLKRVIYIGSVIPLIVYVIWEFIALGIVPIDGPHGIREGYREGDNGAHLIALMLSHSQLALLAQLFSFFAIITSFLGLSVCLADFLADGLKIKPTTAGHTLQYTLTFVPPLLITWYDPRAFLTALEYAGAYGVVTLLGLIPALMVWGGRYYEGLSKPGAFRVKGGKLGLIAVILISLAAIGIELAFQMEWLPTPDM